MKIGITGHTEDLGKELYNLLQKENDVIGFSRTNDYYLENYQKIIQDANDCDVFINNTYHPIYQQKLFEDLFELWKYEEKTIFNILTSAIFYGGSIDEYRENKTKIHDISIELNKKNLDKIVRVVNIYPNTLEHNTRFNLNKVKFSEIYEIINFQLKLPHNLELYQVGISRTTIHKNKSIL